MAEADVRIRCAKPSDYQRVISVVDDWWGGRRMADMLPKLFFVHFQETSFVAEQGETIAGFLVGFFSQTFAGEAYIHFAGTNPEFRRQGLGRSLYEHFFAVSLQNGKRMVRCLTSPGNKASVAFHINLGFAMEPSETMLAGIPIQINYDGPGGDRVLFIKQLDSQDQRSGSIPEHSPRTRTSSG